MKDMEINTLICDLDGTLLAPSGGVHVSKRVEEALIALQEQGMTIVLASARIFQGVRPLAKQLQMERYHGYIIAQNGTMGYDVANDRTLFVHDIQIDDSMQLWKLATEKGLDFGVAQPAYMVASGFSEGFYLDRFNCQVDYLLTDQPQSYVKDVIWKCSASAQKETIDAVFDTFQQQVEATYPYHVIRSTETFVDVIHQGCSKENGLKELFALTNQNFEHAAAIGDGNSDAEMIRLSAYGVTLENGSERCKQYAKRIVPSYEQEGCLELFEELLKK